MAGESVSTRCIMRLEVPGLPHAEQALIPNFPRTSQYSALVLCRHFDTMPGSVYTPGSDVSSNAGFPREGEWETIKLHRERKAYTGFVGRQRGDLHNIWPTFRVHA